MKYKLTFALVATLTSTAFAEFKAPLPEFKNEKQLAEWRAENACEVTSQGSLAETNTFYTGKPYLASSGGYAFKYRSYNPGLARWTSEDPSGFPDGSNQNIYTTNRPLCWLDPNGLSGVLVIYSASSGKSSFSTSGHSWISYTQDGGATTTYGTWGNNPNGKGNGLHTDLETGAAGDVSRTTNLDDDEESDLMGVISKYTALGANGWTLTNPCSGLASEAWKTATSQNENLSDGWPASTPTKLKSSIYKANGNENTGFLE